MKSTNRQPSRATKTGIILFSRSRNVEARSKKWHSSHRKNLQIAEHLIERTKSVLENTGCDVIRMDETKQRGHTFGEKIRFAFEDVYDLGYERLILVGNDSVGLSEAYIKESIEFLSEERAVFGATDDNGLYLIGFERDFFYEKSEEIANLPWRKNRLLTEFSDLTGFTGKSILPILQDVNTIDDIKHLLKKRMDVFSAIIQRIIHGLSEISNRESHTFLLSAVPADVTKRGPPQFLNS